MKAARCGDVRTWITDAAHSPHRPETGPKDLHVAACAGYVRTPHTYDSAVENKRAERAAQERAHTHKISKKSREPRDAASRDDMREKKRFCAHIALCPQQQLTRKARPRA